MKNAFEYEEELAALREELARCRSGHTNLVDRNALLRQRPDLPADRIPAHDKLISLQQRLTAAEQRNTIMTKALERITRPHDCGCVPCTGSCASKYALEIALEEIREIAGAAIKPTESGASDAERKEDDRWLQMKDDAERADYFDESGASE